ncbi:MAG: FHA domain-containing protein [Myxococcaceae bacterium]
MLSCTAGPKAGSEFPLDGDEMVVGRATEATISVPDTSVSRKHCVFKREGNGWVVADLGSGNGTLVNGEPVTEDRPLMSGDTITVGDTEFTFRDESNATMARPAPSSRPGQDSTNPMASPPPPPARRSSAGRPDVRARLGRAGAPAPDPAAKAKQKKIMIGVAVGVVLIIGAAIAIKVKNDKTAALEAQKRNQAQQALNAVQTTFQDGKNLAAQGKWQDAKTKFESIQEDAQNWPQIAQSLQTYLDRANKEIPNQAALGEAEKALGENRLGDAASNLSKVTEDTQMFELRSKLKTQLKEKISMRQQEAQQAMLTNQKPDLEKARDITDDILKADPENRNAKATNDQAKEAIDKIDHPVVGPGPEKAKPWESAVARYKAGDATGALAMLDECASKKSNGKDAAKCKSMAGDVREVIGLAKKLESLDANGLSKLIKLDKQIAGGNISPLGRPATTQAASKFCKQASNFKQSGNWIMAAKWAGEALNADPESQCAKALVADLRTRCRDTYMRAYSIKDSQPDDAAPIFREAVAVCAGDEETKSKSQHWLDIIEKGH